MHTAGTGNHQLAAADSDAAESRQRMAQPFRLFLAPLALRPSPSYRATSRRPYDAEQQASLKVVDHVTLRPSFPYYFYANFNQLSSMALRSASIPLVRSFEGRHPSHLLVSSTATAHFLHFDPTETSRRRERCRRRRSSHLRTSQMLSPW